MSVADEIDGFAVYTDITERKKREQELQRYETIVEKGVVNESLIMEYKQVLREQLSSKYDKDIDVVETEITRSDGETRFIQAYTSLLPYEESFRGSVQVYHDVTERRQNERLAEFANIVSHDLRNPLNVAKGHLDLLERESTPGTLPARTAPGSASQSSKKSSRSTTGRSRSPRVRRAARASRSPASTYRSDTGGCNSFTRQSLLSTRT